MDVWEGAVIVFSVCAAAFILGWWSCRDLYRGGKK